MLAEFGVWTEGTVIRGKFRILRKIGQGGMGAVYEALHLRFNERRALKVMSPEVVSDPEFVKRFEREAILTRRLQHPNAVHVDDIEEAEDGRPYIVMEFVEGQSLKRLIQEAGPLPVPRVCTIIKQVASALEAAHQLGMVHRDIKPDNIVLMPTPTGEQAKVLDFGIARLKESRLGETNLTATGVVIGTPQYMSPEQALGKRGDELDGRSDLYSLGCVMYEMLTGALPFAANTTLALLQAHAFQPPRPIAEVRPDLILPKAITSLVMRCLAKNRDDRPASAQVLINELEQAERQVETVARTVPTRKFGEPETAVHAAPSHPVVQAATPIPAAAPESWTWRWSEGWRFLVLLGSYMLLIGIIETLLGVGLPQKMMVAAVLGTIAVGGWYLAWRRRGAMRWIGIILLILLAGQMALLLWMAGRQIRERHASEGNLSASETAGVHIETPPVRCLEGHAREVSAVVFSLDGKLLASVSSDSTLKMWDVDFGEVRYTLTGHPGVRAATFSPDGQTLVTADANNIVFSDLSTGKSKKTIRTASHIVALALSPDGKFLAVGSDPLEGSINNLELWEMPEGKSRGFLKGDTNYVYSLAFSADSSLLASASGDSTVRLWDPQSGTLKQTLKVDDFQPGFALLPGGQQLVSILPDRGPAVLDITSGAAKALRVDFAASFALSPDGKTLAVGGYWEEQPAEIELIDVASGTVKRRLKGPHSSVRSLAFSPDGKLLASGGLRLGAANPNDPSSKPPGGTVYLWHLE